MPHDNKIKCPNPVCTHQITLPTQPPQQVGDQGTCILCLGKWKVEGVNPLRLRHLGHD
jgi:hypothetical protein